MSAMTVGSLGWIILLIWLLYNSSLLSLYSPLNFPIW